MRQGSHRTGLFRVLGAPVGASKLPGKRFIRIAKSLGLPSTSSGRDITQAINQAKRLLPIPPAEFKTGPVKYFNIAGEDINLKSLPIPMLHEADGGRYLQTFGMFIVQSPDGVHRAHSQHVAGKGEDMPFALCFELPPAAIMVSGMPIPKGVNESGFVGAMIGKPVEVTRCETSEIRIPRDAELVLEGLVSVTETADEGPFVEYHGHAFQCVPKPAPVFRVDAITYRKDPILPICVTGRATEESETVWALT
ncbi:hypothetical protein Landi51_09073 [Colletotrichum acutatum]